MGRNSSLSTESPWRVLCLLTFTGTAVTWCHLGSCYMMSLHWFSLRSPLTFLWNEASLCCCCCCCLVARSCLTLCHPMDYSTPGFPVLSISRSLLKHVSIESVMPSNRLVLCCPLLSCFQSFSASGCFLMSWVFTSCGQSIEASASASVLPMNIQDWFPLGFDWFDLLEVQVTPKSVLRHHSSKASILQCSGFFMVQLSHPYMTIGKTIAWPVQTCAGKVMSLKKKKKSYVSAF